MRTVTFTEFRNQASGLLSSVEQGEVLIVMRHGRPIAEVCPISDRVLKTPSWKEPGLRLTIPGARLSAAILEARRRDDLL